MRAEFSGTCLTVIREEGDPRFSGVRNAAGESRLLYHLKNLLNAMDFDLIKKRMSKDGHMVDDMQQYLRTRKPTGDPAKDVMIHNPSWSIEGAEIRFNRDGRTTLTVVRDCFSGGSQPV